MAHAGAQRPSSSACTNAVKAGSRLANNGRNAAGVRAVGVERLSLNDHMLQVQDSSDLVAHITLVNAIYLAQRDEATPALDA